jgi:hypothetical protein
MNDRYCLPVPKYHRWLAWLLRLLQRRCKHYALKADILEGCGGDYSVRWCETCGAVCTVINCAHTPMRDCQPTWE